MRKLKRRIAKVWIKNLGIPHPCRHVAGEKSYFAKHWRDLYEKR